MTTEDAKVVAQALCDRLGEHDKNRIYVQEKLHSICDIFRKEADDFEERTNNEIEAKFKAEDSRLQSALNSLRAASCASTARLAEAIQEAKAQLLIKQSYDLVLKKIISEYNEYDNDLIIENSWGVQRFELSTKRTIDTEFLELKKPSNLRVTGVEAGHIYMSHSGSLSKYEEEMLSVKQLSKSLFYRGSLYKRGDEGKTSPEEKVLEKNSNNSFSLLPSGLEANTKYRVKVRALFRGLESEWSEEAEFTTPDFAKCCVWKSCPKYFGDGMAYCVKEDDVSIVTKTFSRYWWTTVIGSTPLPHNKVTSWNIKILKSLDNNGSGIYIGVSPSDINQNEGENFNRCGWYFNCYDSTLCSGPPHNYKGKEYGPRKKRGKYVHTGDSVGVVMDTAKGELSFVVDGVNFGVAYDGIPLDKPLVPCVLIKEQGDCLKLNTNSK